MPLHRKQNQPPAFLPARLTSFAAHNLGDNPGAGHGGPPATLPASVNKIHHAPSLGEIRTLGLPFAAPLVPQNRLAVA